MKTTIGKSKSRSSPFRPKPGKKGKKGKQATVAARPLTAQEKAKRKLARQRRKQLPKKPKRAVVPRQPRTKVQASPGTHRLKKTRPKSSSSLRKTAAPSTANKRQR